MIELWRGDHRIVAQIVWRDGARAGLHTEERIPVEAIMSASQCRALQLVAADGARIERRKNPRAAHDDARVQARAIEFLGLGAILLALTIALATFVVQAIAAPLAKVQASLVAQ